MRAAVETAERSLAARGHATDAPPVVITPYALVYIAGLAAGRAQAVAPVPRHQPVRRAVTHDAAPKPVSSAAAMMKVRIVFPLGPPCRGGSARPDWLSYEEAAGLTAPDGIAVLVRRGWYGLSDQG